MSGDDSETDEDLSDGVVEADVEGMTDVNVESNAVVQGEGEFSGARGGVQSKAQTCLLAS